MTVTFDVPGHPVQQGSTKGWLNPKTGRVQVTHDNSAQLRSWRLEVKERAQQAMAAEGVRMQQDGGVVVMACFRLQRPKSIRRVDPEVRPDLDKLTRALLDALTGIAYHDDAQVVRLLIDKVYSASPGLICTFGSRREFPTLPDPEQLDLLGAST